MKNYWSSWNRKKKLAKAARTETHQRTGAKDAAHMGTYEILNN